MENLNIYQKDHKSLYEYMMFDFHSRWPSFF